MHLTPTWKILGIIAVAATAAVSLPHAAAARGHSSKGADPLVAAEAQRHHSEEIRTKHRRAMDLLGAEIRDSKKSAEDSKQSEMQNELGMPTEQLDRWGLGGSH